MDKTVALQYLLSEKGQKKSILNGGDGKSLQSIEVPLTSELLKLASVNENGDVVIKFGINETVDYEINDKDLTIQPVFNKKFNEPQSTEQLLEYKNNLSDYLDKRKKFLNKTLLRKTILGSMFLILSALSIIFVIYMLFNIVEK